MGSKSDMISPRIDPVRRIEKRVLNNYPFLKHLFHGLWQMDGMEIYSMAGGKEPYMGRTYCKRKDSRGKQVIAPDWNHHIQLFDLFLARKIDVIVDNVTGSSIRLHDESEDNDTRIFTHHMQTTRDAFGLIPSAWNNITVYHRYRSAKSRIISSGGIPTPRLARRDHNCELEEMKDALKGKFYEHSCVNRWDLCFARVCKGFR